MWGLLPRKIFTQVFPSGQTIRKNFLQTTICVQLSILLSAFLCFYCWYPTFYCISKSLFLFFSRHQKIKWLNMFHFFVCMSQHFLCLSFALKMWSTHITNLMHLCSVLFNHRGTNTLQEVLSMNIKPKKYGVRKKKKIRRKPASRINIPEKFGIGRLHSKINVGPLSFFNGKTCYWLKSRREVDRCL